MATTVGLVHSPADIVAQLLIDLGLGTDPTTNGTWPIYVGREPTIPDNCITVYDTAGVDDGRSMIDGETWNHYGFQVRVRSVDHRTGWVKADTISSTMAMNVLRTSTTITDSDGTKTNYRIQCIARIGDTLKLGKEVPTSKRDIFTVNATMTLLNEVPTLRSVTVNAAGNQATFVFSEAVHGFVTGNNGFLIQDESEILNYSLSYVSGNGTTVVVFSVLFSPIPSGVHLAHYTPGVIADADNAPLALVNDFPVTNNSTV